jgi:DmsE family decaheme c-type cytochrome
MRTKSECFWCIFKRVAQRRAASPERKANARLWISLRRAKLKSMPGHDRRGTATAVLLVGLLACGLLAQGVAAQSPAASPTQTAAQPAASTQQTPALKPGYVGSDACKICHEEIYDRFTKSIHFGLENNRSRGWEGMACESCHGPGAKHADSADPTLIIQPAKLAPPASIAVCLGCHRNSSTPVGRILAGHAKDTVACYECHAVHGAGGRPLVLTKASDINSQCASCHAAIWAAFQKPYRHRLPEGAMSCTNCHNPHASDLPQTMRVAFGNEPTCFQCHSDKRGPFVFEHAPVRLEGCMACHEPHGSANPRMLIRHEVRFVCLECHANNPPLPASITGAATVRLNNLGQIPPAFHDLRSPRFQNCTVCHVKIHGSYVNRYFEQ